MAILTRYLGSHLRESLEHEELKVAKVSELNDVFEFRYCHIGEYGPVQAKQSIKKREKVVQEFQDRFNKKAKSLGISRNNRRKALKTNRSKMEDALVEKMPKHFMEQAEQCQARADSTLRILCFSKPTNCPNEEILRWSHYTNNHVGARIWIDMSKQKLPLQKEYPVTYQDDLVAVDNQKTDDPNYMDLKYRESMVTKAKCWEYEGEVRSFIPEEIFITKEVSGHHLYFVPIQLNGILRIDFGIRFPEEESAQIIKDFRGKLDPEVQFYQAGCKQDKYEIEYRPLK